jgi:hypothetical protein
LPSLILRLEPLDGPDDPIVLPHPSSEAEGATKITLPVRAGDRAPAVSALDRWVSTVSVAGDACMVLDSSGLVVAISAAAQELLGIGSGPTGGHHVLDVVPLVDLETGEPNPEYAPRITPLVVLEAGGLARSWLRVRHEDDAIVTLDLSSAAIHDSDGHLVGSVTFVALIPPR